MDASSRYPEAPVPPAPPVSAPAAYSSPQPEPKKRMSKGAKWAIGLGAGFVLLTLLSCCASVFLLAGDGPSLGLGNSIALIRIEGVIEGGGYHTTSPEYVIDQIDQALADTNVKAIMLRIDSPGGTVAASQEMMLAVRRASEDKPVIASVGDICASGGYMVASQCDEIVASPGSTVGSIGVIMEVANVEGLLEKLGLKFTTLTQGEYKDAGSPFRDLSEAETALLNDQMTVVYDQFIADVAKGRGMKVSKVRELATGWAWLGSEALDLGLIDSLGNYNDAVDRAADLGGIDGEPNIVSYEYVDPFTDLFETLIGLASPTDELDAESLRRLGLPR